MRKKFLIKPDIQFRHLIWTIGTILFCFFLSYALFETQISTSLSYGPLDQARWLELRHTLRLGLLLALFVLIICIGIENYLFFHTIIGPLFVMERALKGITEGNFDSPLKIRTSDQLKDLIKSFEKMRSEVRHRLQEQEKLNKELTDNLEEILANVSSTRVRALRQKIREIRAQMENKAA